MIVDIFAQDFFSDSSQASTSTDENLRQFRGFASFRKNFDQQEPPLQVFRFAKYRQN